MSSTYIRTAFFVLLVAIVVVAQKPPVTIVNSGSTNTPGYTIIIQNDGNTHYYIAPSRAQIANSDGTCQQPTWTNGTAQLSSSTRKSLYCQIKHCEPFNKLPVESCGKSVSFGFTLKLTYNGETTPDLSCPTTNQKLENLITTVNKVISELKI
ncbi:unnamed protein product [Adineta steineri]|uniref:Secreted protein n=1 Tax=Adineta steineri TaxID=433720 RepID=A0A813WQI2_9BILA|nr:unnamed protein product [Adineta steineri]